ncbi:MAG: protein-export chaperone SecB [Bacteroidota bacterium]|nr:protein-export chaperone SecB [Bacteroidota bacterium]
MKKSDFQFDSFIVTKSLFELNHNLDFLDLNINFKPTGKLDKTNNKFNLILGVKINDTSNNLNIDVEFIGYFKYTNLDDSNIKNFLYQNAPAILFPYIRAYISTLTTLSGINPIVLPTLNLVHLKDDLLNNIEEVDLS